MPTYAEALFRAVVIALIALLLALPFTQKSAYPDELSMRVGDAVVPIKVRAKAETLQAEDLLTWFAVPEVSVPTQDKKDPALVKTVFTPGVEYEVVHLYHRSVGDDPAYAFVGKLKNEKGEVMAQSLFTEDIGGGWRMAPLTEPSRLEAGAPYTLEVEAIDLRTQRLSVASKPDCFDTM